MVPYTPAVFAARPRKAICGFIRRSSATYARPSLRSKASLVKKRDWLARAAQKLSWEPSTAKRCSAARAARRRNDGPLQPRRGLVGRRRSGHTKAPPRQFLKSEPPPIQQPPPCRLRQCALELQLLRDREAQKRSEKKLAPFRRASRRSATPASALCQKAAYEGVGTGRQSRA